MFSSRNKKIYFLFCWKPVLGLLILPFFWGCSAQKTAHQQIIIPKPPPVIYNHYGSFNLRIPADSVEYYSSSARLRTLKQKGFNTITIDVFDNFHSIVPLHTREKFSIPESKGVTLVPETLKTFIELAQTEGLAVWMGITTLPLSVSIKEASPDLYLYLESWFMINLEGEYLPSTEPFFYLCPQHPLVKEFFLSLITEFQETYSFNGIVLSGVQYPFLSHLAQHSFCLCQYCKDTAREEHGVDLLKKHASAISSDMAKQTLFYNDSLKGFVQHQLHSKSIPDSNPFLVEIHGDYSLYQNPYYQDYFYWSESLPSVEFIFKFRSFKTLAEEFASIEMNVPLDTLIGLLLDPLIFRESEYPVNDFFEFFFLLEPYSTLMVDVRNLSPVRIDNFINTLSERKILYPWNDLNQTIKIMLQAEYDAPYLTSISQERVAIIYTHFSQYLVTEKMEEKQKIRESLIDSWIRTTHLVNVKNTPALKNLQIAFKYFHFAHP